jgi:hypothetical protein
LHHACRRNATERIIEHFFVFTRGAQIKDDQTSCRSLLLPKRRLASGCQPHAHRLPVHQCEERFGYTPLAKPKLWKNKMDPVIEVLEQFKKEQDKIKIDNETPLSAS